MHIAPGMLAARDLADLDLRMEVEQAQQFPAGVTAAADDARPDHAVTLVCSMT